MFTMLRRCTAAVSRARTTTPTPLKVGLSVRLRLLSKTLVADVADIDGGRGGLRVTFQCGTSKKMTVTTKRSGRASLRLSRLAVRTPAKCRATTKSFAATVRSKVLKLR